jgi:hypothetical protein
MMRRPHSKSATYSAKVSLPSATTKRWVIRRKAQVVAAVQDGVLSLEEACSRYKLTIEELLAWQTSIERHGVAGLRTTRLQQYRMWSGAGTSNNLDTSDRAANGR